MPSEVKRQAEAGRATSGYLIEYEETRVVLDLGYGTLPRLLTHCPDADVDAVVITHEHPDHCVDLSALYRLLYYTGRRTALYCPPGVLDRIGQLEPRDDLRDAFDMHELPGDHDIGPLRLTSVALPHHVPNAGVRLAAPEATVAYTGDTGPDPALATLGADADLYIMEATGKDSRYLLTAGEAGRWAARAGARRLMLTHFWPGSDRAAAAAAARAEYAGEIVVATEDLRVRW